MLEQVGTNNDDLYWVTDTIPTPLKHKRVSVDEESLNNSISMVKTTVSQKKKEKSQH